MFRKGLIRILVSAILITAIYFLFLRNQSRSSEAPRSFPRPAENSFGPEPRRKHPGSRRDRRYEEPDSDVASDVECRSVYFSHWDEPAFDSCDVRIKNGYPVPDPHCTPGGINPSVSVNILRDVSWRTRSVRNCASSEAQKHIAYRWYNIQKPRINSNQNQVCELDHLVPLELGGADGLGNIWPQCGPDEVTLNERYFKQKDHVENYLAEQVRAGRIPLDSAQRGIASDWTQYIADADRWCDAHGRC